MNKHSHTNPPTSTPNPFGMLMPQRVFTAGAYKFGFNGQEKDDEIAGAGNLLTAQYWEYDTRIGRRWNLDPIKKPWQSNYVCFSNSPIFKFDPDGKLDNPIYDTEGTLLGTDDKGLQGEAIIMDKDNFSQGMKHETALKFDLGLKGLKDKTAVDKYAHSYSMLPTRPDYDGYLTKPEADKWWTEKSGQPLYVDQSKIELPGVTTKTFDMEGKSFTKNFIWDLSNTGKVYGTIRLTLMNSKTGQVYLGGLSYYLDTYDFNPDGRTLRDIATYAGKPILDGTDYKIYSYGFAKVHVDE